MMPFYNTKKPGHVGVFPHKPTEPAGPRKEGPRYAYMTQTDLIRLCKERGITTAKGVLPKHQKKAYYIDLLIRWDRLNELSNEDTPTGAD